MKGQWKLFKGQGKFREFLTFWRGATLNPANLFFVKRGVVIETLIDSNSGEIQFMKPFTTPIVDFHYRF